MAFEKTAKNPADFCKDYELSEAKTYSNKRKYLELEIYKGLSFCYSDGSHEDYPKRFFLKADHIETKDIVRDVINIEDKLRKILREYEKNLSIYIKLEKKIKEYSSCTI